MFCVCWYVITYKVIICCLLFVQLPSLLFCVVFFCWEGVVCRCLSFLFIWCFYFHFANNKYVVRTIILSVVLFEFPCCTVIGSYILIACILEIVLLCLYVITSGLLVCCLLFVPLPYFCPVFCFCWTTVFCRCSPFDWYDVCIFNLQTITTSFVCCFFL